MFDSNCIKCGKPIKIDGRNAHIKKCDEHKMSRYREKCRDYAHKHYLVNKSSFIARAMRRQAMLRNCPMDADIDEHVKLLYNLPVKICFYCRRVITSKSTYEHVMCISKGGGHTKSNVTLNCSFCNHSKNNKSPEEFLAFIHKNRPEEYLRFVPFFVDARNAYMINRNCNHNKNKKQPEKFLVALHKHRPKEYQRFVSFIVYAHNAYMINSNLVTLQEQPVH